MQKKNQQLKAKKFLGQHFLRSHGVLYSIVREGDVQPNDTVLEIGPGRGALTQFLLREGGRVIAIEKDRDLIEPLKERFASEIGEGRLIIIDGDILEVSLKSLPFKGHYKVVANIPYNITGAILEKFLEEEPRPSRMTLLVQKEVGQRIVAKDHKQSILSLAIALFGDAKLGPKVSRRMFNPAPKVDSIIVTIIPKEAPRNAKEILSVIKRGFLHKRKMVIGNLASFYKRTELEQIFDTIGVPQKSRAEDIPLLVWISLALHLHPQKQ